MTPLLRTKRGKGQRRNKRRKHPVRVNGTTFGFGYPGAFGPLFWLTDPTEQLSPHHRRLRDAWLSSNNTRKGTR